MRLIYDLRILENGMHGMARYGLELLRAMLEQDPELSVGVLLRRPEHARHLPADPRLVALACDLAPYGVKAQLRLPRLLSALDMDLYHCPFYAPPALFAGPVVFTIHDLIHLRFPRHHGPKHRLFYRLVVGPAARRARVVFTVSRHSRQDIVEMLGVDPRRVVLTPNGVGPAFRPLEGDAAQAVEELGWPREYLLGVGNPRPHKNLAALVVAHRLLEEERGPEAVPPLVLVGVRPGELAGVRPGPRLILCGQLDDRELALAYGAARAVVIPSLYEGFGLPALEALACGAPLVASNRASLPEVVGRAGLLCEPDAASLAATLGRLLEDDELAAELREAGPRRAARFTWRRAARQALAAYRRVLEGGRR